MAVIASVDDGFTAAAFLDNSNDISYLFPLSIAHPIQTQVGKAMFATWLFGSKTLELPEVKYLCIKKMGKLKKVIQIDKLNANAIIELNYPLQYPGGSHYDKSKT